MFRVRLSGGMQIYLELHCPDESCHYFITERPACFIFLILTTPIYMLRLSGEKKIIYEMFMVKYIFIYFQ